MRGRRHAERTSGTRPRAASVGDNLRVSIGRRRARRRRALRREEPDPPGGGGPHGTARRGRRDHGGSGWRHDVRRDDERAGYRRRTLHPTAATDAVVMPVLILEDMVCCIDGVTRPARRVGGPAARRGLRVEVVLVNQLAMLGTHDVADEQVVGQPTELHERAQGGDDQRPRSYERDARRAAADTRHGSPGGMLALRGARVERARRDRRGDGSKDRASAPQRDTRATPPKAACGLPAL